jgi:hypothetical protein
MQTIRNSNCVPRCLALQYQEGLQPIARFRVAELVTLQVRGGQAHPRLLLLQRHGQHRLARVLRQKADVPEQELARGVLGVGVHPFLQRPVEGVRFRHADRDGRTGGGQLYGHTGRVFPSWFLSSVFPVYLDLMGNL